MEHKFDHKKYDIVIGLEIHAELNTKTKCFCGCANEFGSAPNTNVCPVCLAMPGALPVLNRAAVEKTILAGLAIDCDINDLAIFERKHYFYPDLSKAYQISQLVKPICLHGGIKLKNGKFVRLNRIHLEEDAGKLLHNSVNQTSLVDYNRGGVPLIEIVTEPDISSAAEAVEFLEQIRGRLVYAGVAQCKMEQGGMRCDVNLSLKLAGSATLGNRCEIKNLNSFRSVSRAIEFESLRQAEILDAGGKIITETRKWDDAKGKTSSMRNKEESQDYRYFPDPDIYAVKITRDDVENIKKTMPILPHQLREIFELQYALPEYDADILTRSKPTADFYLECLKILNEPKHISNWILTDIMARMNDRNLTEIPVTPEHLCQIIKPVLDKTITKVVGLTLLDEIIKNPKTTPMLIAKAMGFLTAVDDQTIIDILTKLKAEKPNLVADYTANPSKVLPFLIGQVMKATQGKAKSDIVEKIIASIFKR
jgi:aspartyl-tRNA(Asn)/glutamyl-tRNA(Gln) amidotransferase subunit B